MSEKNTPELVSLSSSLEEPKTRKEARAVKKAKKKAVKKQRKQRKHMNSRVRMMLFLSLLAFASIIVTFMFFIYFSMSKAEGEIDIYLILSECAFGIIMTGILVFVAWWFYRLLISKPLAKLMEATNRVAKGDFKVRLEPTLTKKGEYRTEFDLLYANFNLMVSELESTEMLKTDFVSNISHELKTPIAVISNMATLLQSDGLSTEERAEYTKRISEASTGLSHLISDILQLSRLENQKIKPQGSVFNLSEQLCRCLLNFEEIWEKKNIEVETEFPSDIRLESDEHLLDIVWNNLLSNALKFTPDNGKIKVAAKSENQKVMVSVQDNGCGMSAADMKHIFEKFYQADTSHAVKGNGLGLAMVWNILKLLDGKIEVASEAGKGSRFTVILPASQNEEDMNNRKQA